MEQIKDTPRVTCAICEELHFERNNKCFTEDLETVYMGLTLNEKTFTGRKICISCKRSLQNGKMSQFATPDQIRRNKPLAKVSSLSELEERLVSL
jgi:hypothetical protein